MNQTPPDPRANPPSVLQVLAQRTGFAPKVLLSDSGSEHGASPMVAAGTPLAKRGPKGRGNYQILGEIARGGMGVILKGHDTDLGRDVAVKVLDPELAQDPAVVQRFVEEAQIGGQLQHPGIVPVYELGLMADESPYFTMKLVKGRTLAAHFAQRKSPSENRGALLAIFEAVCQTVAYAHSKGVLHRDLKPANVMVGAFGEVQVVDWGLAKVLRRGGVADEKRAKDSLQTVIATVRSGPGSSGSDSLMGSVMGTPAYMAPEQAQGEIEKLDERADVFSLGAILCELLTGRAPYEEREGESVVRQAARAELDPARERLASSGAEPLLVRLCLECMTPARAGRPANAEAVARGVHEYLSTVEERARKAEVEAAEQRVRAVQERRARRLTLALGSAVVLALALAGGGLWWIEHERGARFERTRSAVAAAHGAAIEHSQAGRFEQALAEARRALSLAEADSQDTALIERAGSFVAKAKEDVGAAERERALLAMDTALRERLIGLRLQQVEGLGDVERERALDAAFSQAFRAFGLDLEAQDLVPALKRIRERAIAEEVALALDDWGRVRRKVHGARSEEAQNLFDLAMDLDHDPVRQRMREAIAAGDLDTLLELSAIERLGALEPGSIFVISSALWDAGERHRPHVYRTFERALHLYPGDYVLQSVGGRIYQRASRFETALACWVAALSLRPDDPEARMRAADGLYFLGRLPEAQSALTSLIAAHPSLAEAHYSLALCSLQLGDLDRALAGVERALELREDATWRADQLGIRYYAGLADRSELDAAIQRAFDPIGITTLLYPLLDHHDPGARDAEFALKTLEQCAQALASADWSWLIFAIAHLRAGDFAAVIASLEGRYTPPTVMFLTPGAIEFVRAIAFAGLGRSDIARECHARGEAHFARLAGGDEAAWEHSDIARWKRESQRALGR